MPQPTLVHENYNEKCAFEHDFIPELTTLPKITDFLIQSLPSRDYLQGETKYGTIGNVPFLLNGKWIIEEAIIRFSTQHVHFYCESSYGSNTCAFPVDPRMTKTDIEDATIIYPNSTNTGWLFAHAEIDHHHERILTLESVMITLFEDLVHNELENTLKTIVNAGSSNQELAGRSDYNSQLGALSNYSQIVAFRKECVKWCSELEKLLHVGQHVQENNFYLKHQLVRAIKQAIKVWQADANKSRVYATISGQINALIAKIETEHKIETRWEKQARREAAAKAAADAANNGD